MAGPTKAKPKLGSRRSPTPLKPKRVRTGCFTCRRRHLKCDEAFPVCLNCSRSKRHCDRTLQPKWNHTVVFRAPRVVTHHPRRNFIFEDESRKTANDYVGGVERYDRLTSDLSPSTEIQSDVALQPHSFDSAPKDPSATSEHHKPDVFNVKAFSRCYKAPKRARTLSRVSSADDVPGWDSNQQVEAESRTAKPRSNKQPSLERFIRDQSCDEDVPNFSSKQHISQFLGNVNAKSQTSKMRLTPGRRQISSSSTVPVLRNSAPARWLEDVFYIEVCLEEIGIWMDCVNNSADLMRRLSHQTPTAASFVKTLLACGVMKLSISSFGKGHIADLGPKASIAWLLRIPTESLVCLIQGHGTIDKQNWAHISWIEMGSESTEQLWCRRMLFILATISNFRASIPRLRNPDRLAEHLRLNKERLKWVELKQLCDDWDDRCPTSMLPSYYGDDPKRGQHLFPIILMLNRTTVLGRLFYHTAQCILMQAYNIRSARDLEEMYLLQTHHARQICGLVAQTEDIEIAPVAIQSLVATAPVIKQRSEQEEVLRMLDGIKTRSGWHVEGTKRDLTEAWGWKVDDVEPNGPGSDGSSSVTISLEMLTPTTELAVDDAAWGAWELDHNTTEFCIDPSESTEAPGDSMQPTPQDCLSLGPMMPRGVD
ncbi:Adhesion and hyphal regulator 1 [Paramyrothecium foliicola]|nr:Adhesion and hyphal regulator 1 [Paramyrothecium foliicola]